MKEHQKEVTTIEKIKYTRNARKSSTSAINKSAITDHVQQKNCVINWEQAKVIDRENHRTSRWIKEAIWLRKTPNKMNRDEGGYRLSHAWDGILTTRPPGGE